MKKTVIKCDLCAKDGKSYRYKVDKTMDPSGNGYEINFKFIDLCFDCVQSFARKNLNHQLLEVK